MSGQSEIGPGAKVRNLQVARDPSPIGSGRLAGNKAAHLNVS